MSQFVLVIHGGAGGVVRGQISIEREQGCRSALTSALEVGYAILKNSGSALDAVEESVRVLEDSPFFNAGHGSVLNSQARVEMDASIMDGRTMEAGAVSAVQRSRNPVSVSRLVMEKSPHVLLTGSEADDFASSCGASMESPDYFLTEYRVQQQLEGGSVTLDHGSTSKGTVGAACRDSFGHLAAATSTGGLCNKLPGRVGDSAGIGAGTWARDGTCAVSATGDGEIFIRAAFSHEIDAQMRLAGASLALAVERSLTNVATLGGEGGCVAVDSNGHFETLFNSAGMFRGVVTDSGKIFVAMYGDERLE